MRRIAVHLFFLFVFVIANSPAAAAVDPALLGALEARSIGPAGMSGRVADVVALDKDPDVIYVGAATGGVWKSTNGGLTFEPIFDDQRVAAVGSIAVSDSNPDVIWVGTGEGNPRNSSSVGAGLYRSRDGGESWKLIGLENTERIHRILLHPHDPNVIYVAALGRAWGENAERGVFKTTDGGKSWTKVLYVSPSTGAADLVMDPANPDKLIAAMWDFRRWPWSFRSGGPGSGIFTTFDGGANWKRASSEDGLPKGDLGRIGLAIAPSNPKRVYALVEADKNALYRSDDGGATWKNTGAQKRFGNRPFYYADLRVDPKNPDRVYSLWSAASVSDDAGKTWRIVAPFSHVHPDHHAMWINPADPAHIIAGNDGGVAISRDRGASWQFVTTLPLAQYYHIAVDMDVPYNVYGGMQDNGSWRGPSTVWENGGIRDYHWEEVGFGDGFDTLPDPEDSTTGYAMSQQGYVQRWNLETGEKRMIRPAAEPGDELRFNWNAGIAIDPFDPATIYFGSQYVHRSRDRGETWERISDDLTTDNPEWQKQDESGGLTLDVTGAENFTSILVIAPSTIEKGVIWVGTDDGRVHVTRNGGENWTSVESNARGVPDNTWVPHIEPSGSDPGSALVVFDDHRRSNWETYAYRVTDHGRRWQRFDTSDVDGFALCIAQDPVSDNLLFLGTEFGLYVSLDGGKNWFKWTHGVPTVPVRDLVIHPRDHDLVLGTHGRATIILDDIRPLRELADGKTAGPLHLFEVAPAQQHEIKQTGASRFPGHGEFRGKTRPYGALISLMVDDADLPLAEKLAEMPLPDSPDADSRAKAVVRVYDEAGELLRTLRHPVARGVNRVTWDLRRQAFREPPREPSPWGSDDGPEVPPGVYTVKVEYGDHEKSAQLEVLGDPRIDISQADRRANWNALMRAGSLQETAVEAIHRIKQAAADVDVIMDKARLHHDIAYLKATAAELPEAYTALEEKAEAVKKKLTAAELKLWQPPETQGIPPDHDALSHLGTAQWMLGSTKRAPTQAQLDYLARAERTLRQAIEAVNGVFDEEVADFRKAVRSRSLELLATQPALQVP